MKAQSNWLLALRSRGGVVGLFALASIGLMVRANGAEPKSEPPAGPKILRERVEQLGAKYLTKRPKGALVIGVVRHGEEHWLGFGQVSAINTNAPDAQTIFEIGSVTKVFTGTALGLLVEEGKLRLEDTLAEVLPAEVKLPPELQKITLTQLATHTAGLPRLPGNLNLFKTGITNPYAQYTSKELYEYLRTAKLTEEPGKKSTYSNLGVGLLGHILELRAGVPYEQLVRDRIRTPLGMTNSNFKLTATQRAMLTPGHNAKGEVVPNWDFAVLTPAGGLRSCVADMLRFLAANVATNQTSLNAGVVRAQKAYHESRTGKVGLCWQIFEMPGVSRLLWHNGGTGGYVSFIGINRASQTGVVLLSNYGDAMAGDNSLDEMGMELLKLASKVSWE